MLMNFKKINHDILLLDICCNFINNESILEKWHYINNIYNDLQKNREIYIEGQHRVFKWERDKRSKGWHKNQKALVKSEKEEEECIEE